MRFSVSSLGPAALLGCLAVAIVDCGSSSATSGDSVDGGGDALTGDGPPTPGTDGGADAPDSPLDASADANGCDPLSAKCVQPPTGTTKCGSGAIDPAAAAAACDALDAPTDLHVGATKSCSAFTLTSGHYEVWCSSTAVYVWVSLDDVSSAAVTSCTASAPLPDGGVVSASYDQLSWDLEYSNATVYYASPGMFGGMAHADHTPFSSDRQTADSASWHGGVSFDGTLNGAPTPTGSGTMFFSTLQSDCNDTPSSASAIVLAAPIVWGM